MARTQLEDLKPDDQDVEPFGFTYSTSLLGNTLTSSTLLTSPTIRSTTLTTSTSFGKLNLSGVLAG